MRRLLASLVTAIGLVLVVLLTPTAANAATAKVDRPDGSLTASWWQKFVAIPSPDSLDQCDVGTGKIVFLAGTNEPGGFDTRICTTAKAKTFLVPLINVECSTAEGNGQTFAELTDCARGIADDFTNLKLIIDDQPVSDLNSLRVTAQSTFTSAENNAFPSIPPATDSKFATDGYWALIKLTPGKHTVVFGGAYPPGNFETGVTYTLFVKD